MTTVLDRTQLLPPPMTKDKTIKMVYKAYEPNVIENILVQRFIGNKTTFSPGPKNTSGHAS